MDASSSPRPLKKKSTLPPEAWYAFLASIPPNTISKTEAVKKYGLSKDQLESLNAVKLRNPYKVECSFYYNADLESLVVSRQLQEEVDKAKKEVDKAKKETKSKGKGKKGQKLVHEEGVPPSPSPGSSTSAFRTQIKKYRYEGPSGSASDQSRDAKRDQKRRFSSSDIIDLTIGRDEAEHRARPKKKGRASDSIDFIDLSED